MLMAPPVGQILDWYKWSHIQLAKFGTNASGILFSLSNECNLWVSMWINGRGRYDHIFSDFHQLLRESSVCQSKIKTSSLLHSYTFSTLQYFWNISCCAFAFYNFSPLFMTRSLCGRPIFLYGPARQVKINGWRKKSKIQVKNMRKQSKWEKEKHRNEKIVMQKREESRMRKRE